ncbi:cobalt/nickel transport system permease protein [Rhodobacter aestuarii]|uniref:Cobalt/nickel transport system permease protein n=1 Tax=Rhodobacter aestuarii TaxID=453582 RepID=A0A1N7J4C5_9RHOB|nr:cobalt ECF transporter T component CbiQ [Rhodobacter aestuarii]PTV97210.1 cobalt/nickel transport system permease protein [Rhodobacter aestuarii]SIS44096.1 cobalt/nickel transport system permease protein [Rhodobacter aestuarii]
MSIASLDRIASTGRWRNRPLAEKALIGLGFLILAVTLPPWPGAVFVTAAMLAVTFGLARVSVKLWLAIAALPLGFLIPGSLVLLVQLGPEGIGLAPGGAQEAALLVLRALAATTCLIFLATTTPAADLVAGLRRFGLPSEIVEIALLMYRFVFILAEEATAMTVAQRARLGHSTRARWLRSTGQVIAALLPRAMARARRLEVGLAARGWQGEMRVLSDRARASWLSLGAILAAQAAVAILGMLL